MMWFFNFYFIAVIEPSSCFVVCIHESCLGIVVLLHGPGRSQQSGYGALGIPGILHFVELGLNWNVGQLNDIMI